MAKKNRPENETTVATERTVSDIVTAEARALASAPPRPENPLRVLSLFSGCGGMDAGFEGWFLAHRRSLPLAERQVERMVGDDWVLSRKTRFTTVFANDILPEARAGWLGYMERFGHDEAIFHNGSVVDLVKSHTDDDPAFPADIDVVTGGFPCQDFSVAGKRLGFESHKNHLGKRRDDDDGQATEESRGKLYFWMKQVIDKTRPKVFVAENVKGLVNLKDVKDIIQRDFSNAGNGYIVLDPQVLHAADYGVPESRERVIFIGIRRDALRPEALAALTAAEIPAEYDPYPPATHSRSQATETLQAAVATREVLGALPEPDTAADQSQKCYSKAKYMSNGSQGQIEIKLDGLGPTIRSEHHGNIEFRRLSAEHGGQHAAELAAGMAERRLTPRECAMIQTFPPDFPFVRSNPSHTGGAVSASGAYKVIGNAVPPVLAFNIAQRLEELWPLLFD